MSFRELPPAIVAIKQLKVHLDVFLVNARPSRSVSSPIYLLFAAQSSVSPLPIPDSWRTRIYTDVQCMIVLLDKGEVIGEVVTTEEATREYVSAGQMVSLETAVEIVRHCSKGRIPEPPLLQADNLATEAKLELATTVK